MNLNGATRVFAIIGDPIVQAGTPSILNPLMQAAGVNAVLVPLHVREADFDVVLTGLMRLGNLDGLVVTYPFKERCLHRVDHLSDRARKIGKINAMRRNADGSWSGDMFDGMGLIHAVTQKTPVAGTRVLLIGAGGAGSAIGFAFAEAGATSLVINDLDAARATDLARRVAQAYPACNVSAGPADTTGIDILVNATPVGMAAGDGLPAQLGPIPASMTVVDIVPRAQLTPLLTLASKAGAPYVVGSAMTQGQAGILLEFFGIGSGAH